MNIPGMDLMGPLSLVCLTGAAANAVVKIAKEQPDIADMWKHITTGKQILEFIAEIPEWKNYDRNLKESLESLSRKKTQLHCMEDDLTEEVSTVEFQTNGKRKRAVENWLRNVRAKAHDADITQVETEGRYSVTKLVFRAWLGKCVKKEEEDLTELIGQREALGSGAELVLEPSNGTIQYRLVASALVGKASSSKRLEIWTKLLNRGGRTLGLLGEQGIGKTTMMANIYNLEVAYSDVFKHAFYVNIPRGVDLHHLQAAIGDAMDLRDLAGIRDLSRRANRIKTALDKCGKFLLILDGLCEYFRLTEVGIPIEGGVGKLVVVSRYRNVCRMMSGELVEMERLPESDAEELFMKTLGSPTQLSRGIQGVASEIIRQCGGVPERIVETAESLRGATEIYEWRVKSRELAMLRT